MASSTLAAPLSPASSSPEYREQNANARVIISQLCVGEQLDPLTVALSGFPDVNSYRAYYEGVENEDQ